METNEKDIKKLATKFGYRTYMIERYLALFGRERLEAFLQGNERRITPSIKVNTLKISNEVLKNRLLEKGFKLEPVPLVRDAFYVTKTPFSIGATTEYLMGYYYIQSVASMLPVKALNVKPHEIIVDLCAAPGGKTVHLAQDMQNQGVIIAIDINRTRMKSLRSNISRCGVKNVIAIRMDGADLNKFHLKKISKILIDAPCTGSGLIPIDPSRKTSREYVDIEFCSSIQKKLLRAALECLPRGGEIVYSTCSIEPEENEFLINAVLQSFDVELVDLNLGLGEPGLTQIFGKKLASGLHKARRLYPFLHNMEGYFICKLRKKGKC
ncbi:MAG: RsmB/NOP family class I SAM-dependent RNA methyltransferase [Candidatus Helarchaeota archaeon]